MRNKGGDRVETGDRLARIRQPIPREKADVVAGSVSRGHGAACGHALGSKTPHVIANAGNDAPSGVRRAPDTPGFMIISARETNHED